MTFLGLPCRLNLGDVLVSTPASFRDPFDRCALVSRLNIPTLVPAPVRLPRSCNDIGDCRELGGVGSADVLCDQIWSLQVSSDQFSKPASFAAVEFL
jgi:hypothetical protein